MWTLHPKRGGTYPYCLVVGCTSDLPPKECSIERGGWEGRGSFHSEETWQTLRQPGDQGQLQYHKPRWWYVALRWCDKSGIPSLRSPSRKPIAWAHPDRFQQRGILQSTSPVLLNLGTSPKTRLVWEKVTAKWSLQRHMSWWGPAQKKDMGWKPRTSEYTMHFS